MPCRWVHLFAHLMPGPRGSRGLAQRVLAWREFDARVAAASDDPYGGVVAANQAVHQVLRKVSGFVGETLRAAPMRP